MSIEAILLDIEGTLTPISFVHETLFPYARERLLPFFEAKGEDASVREAVSLLRKEWHADVEAGHQPPPLSDTGSAAGMAAYAEWLMDRDRKSTGLKIVQGLIWEEGYTRGALESVVFPDVPVALKDWTDAGTPVAIYSSGSVHAQRLLFAHTNAGDLSGYIARYFDTTTGPKLTAGSYMRISLELARAPESILFVSDVAAELIAAESVGYQTRLAVRPGNAEQKNAERFGVIAGLEEIGG